MDNEITLDTLVTFDFVIDKAVDVIYVNITTACRFVVKKYEGLSKAFNNVFSSNADSSSTFEGYKIETLNKIIAALEADRIEVPSDEEGYFAWLKNPQK